jgi:hypothetical protein
MTGASGGIRIKMQLKMNYQQILIKKYNFHSSGYKKK